MEMIRNATKTIGMISIIGLLFAVSIGRAQTTVLTGNTATVVNLALIYDGDIVLLKSARGGYLKDDGDNTLSTHPTFNDEGQLWKVEINKNGYGTMFQNLKTDDYLKIGTSVYTGPITGSGDYGSWIHRVYTSSASIAFNFEFVYAQLENYKQKDRCIAVNSVEDTTIEVGTCGGLNSAWRYEVVYRYVAAIDWNEVFKCLGDNYAKNRSSNCGLF